MVDLIDRLKVVALDGSVLSCGACGACDPPVGTDPLSSTNPGCCASSAPDASGELLNGLSACTVSDGIVKGSESSSLLSDLN